MTPVPEKPQTNNPNYLSEAGDLITEGITITTSDNKKYDVSNFCLETVLFEDIFSNTMSGHCMFVDSANLITSIPIQGDDFITMYFRTPSFSERVAKSFKIVSVSGRTFSATDREQVYIISFVSIEAASDNITNLTNKFSGTTDEVVKKIFLNYLSVPRFIDDTSSSTKFLTSGKTHGSSVSFVACSWSPLKAINWVAARSFDTTSQAPTFLLYESNKSFYFVSLEELITEQRNSDTIFAEYIYYPGAQDIQNIPKSTYLYVKPELTKQYKIVSNMKPITQFDILKGQDFGYYASKLIVHDMTLKTYQETIFDYGDNFKKFEHMEKKSSPVFPKNLPRNPEAQNVVRTKSYHIHNDLKDPLFEKWTLQRNSLLFEASNLRIEIEVPGRTDIEVGKLVNFLYPKGVDKPQGGTVESTLDPYMSGLYLITAIKHSFSLNKHVMWLELMKDSFKKPLRNS
jgi:hypothetical protein